MPNDVLSRIAYRTGPGGNFALHFNEHRLVYESVADTLRDHDDFFDFRNPEERRRAIDQNTMVYLQWYPVTPIGSVVLAAPDLESLWRWIDEECILERHGDRGRTGSGP
jgi:hypothetical protein